MYRAIIEWAAEEIVVIAMAATSTQVEAIAVVIVVTKEVIAAVEDLVVVEVEDMVVVVVVDTVEAVVEGMGATAVALPWDLVVLLVRQDTRYYSLQYFIPLFPHVLILCIFSDSCQ